MLKGLNKKGIVSPDEHGYRPMILGGLDVVSARGEVYAYEGAHKLFEASSSFMRKVQRGALRGEYEHPQRKDYGSDHEFIARIQNVIGHNVSHHIRRVWLDFDNVKDKHGRPVIAIMGEVAPSGPKGPILEKTMNNPHENCSFSVRCSSDLSRDRLGRTVRAMNHIVTWDHVPEPGQEIADKFYNPSLEGLIAPVSLSPTLLNRAEQSLISSGDSHSQESAKVSLHDLMVSFGWVEPKRETSRIYGW